MAKNPKWWKDSEAKEEDVEETDDLIGDRQADPDSMTHEDLDKLAEAKGIDLADLRGATKAEKAERINAEA